MKNLTDPVIGRAENLSSARMELSPEEALHLAEQLTRAARLVYQHREHTPGAYTGGNLRIRVEAPPFDQLHWKWVTIHE